MTAHAEWLAGAADGDADEPWASALSRRTRRLYRALAENALAATGARAVTVGRVDPRRARVVCVGFAAGPPDVAERGMAELARVTPGYRPDRFVLPLALNPECHAAFTQGRSLLQPFGRIAAGQKHGLALDVFRDVFGFRYTLHVPILVRGRVAGALDFCFPRWPTPRQTEAARAFARQSQVFLENARLAAALGQRVQALRQAQARAVSAEERVRAGMAEVLHGRVQGGLLAAAQRVAEARAALRADPGQADALLAAVAADLDVLREREVRAASHALHPTVIAAGLALALAQLVERFAPVVRVRLDVAPAVRALDDPLDNRLAPALRLAAYRIAEEALANVSRHAAASLATVRLDLAGGDLVLDVRDDGRGFDAARAPAGLGLASAADRAVLLGGTLSVRSRPGRGTAITARLPLRSGAPAG